MNDEHKHAASAPEQATPSPSGGGKAEKNAGEKTASVKKQAPAARSGTASAAKRSSRDQVTSSTVQSAFPSDRQKARSNSSAPKGEGAKSKKGTVDLTAPRSSKPAHRVIPYLLVLLALFLGVTMILNLVCVLDQNYNGEPSSHMMGPVGYWVSYALFGILGPGVFALPLLILNLAFFWKHYLDNKLLLEKSLVSLLLLIFFCTTIHVFALTGLPAHERALSANELLKNGVLLRGGGVIGGGLAYFLTFLFSIVGGVIVSLCLTVLAAFFFIGMTPRHMLERVRAKRSIRKSQKTPIGADEEPIRQSMRDKHARAAHRSREEASEATRTNEPPAGAVQYTTSDAPHKHKKEKSDEELNPRAMPILDASDETPLEGQHLYLPEEIVKKDAEARAAERAKEEAKRKAELEAAAMAQRREAEETKRREEAAAKRRADEEAIRQADELQRRAVAEAARQKAASARPIPPSERAQQRDALDPVFPRTASKAKMVKKVQKSDRDFELGSIFINLDDHTDPQPRRHAPLPPEVPLPGSAGAGQAGTKPAASTGTAGARPTAATAAASTRPAGGNPPAKAPSAAPSAPTARSGAAPTPAKSSAVQADRTAPAMGASTGKPAQKQAPVFRQAAPAEQTEYGLTNEEFEKREAAGRAIARATASKTAASKAPAKTDGKAPVKTGEKAVKKTTANEPAHAVKPYVFPPISYLHPGEPITVENMEEIRSNMNKLSETLSNFNVRIREITYSCGPTVTRYEIFPDAGVRVRTITNLADDIALSFAVQGVRMEAIAGKSAIGVEVPNTTRSNIYLRDLLESKSFSENQSRLTAGLGADVTGNPLLFDIAKMPHLLVAGTTGSGKSICINCIIMSILFKARPDEVKLVLIDPKKVEFSLYKGLPHLMAPIIVTPKDAAGALQAAVEEMENRFNKIQDVGVHDIAGYNKAAAKDPDLPPMPHVVIIIDELADLMMTARDEVEDSICRLAQKARAAGMHIIVGTQRPSVDVVTGLIKANIPSRIACTVRSQVDSRTILDFAGAEKLLGRGDMLFAPIGSMKPTRVQGAFVSDGEVEKICEFIRATNGTAQYDENFTSKMKEFSAQCGKKGGKAEGDLSLPSGDGGDNKYVDAIRIAIEENRVSTSLLQRKLGIGYSRAAKIIDRMEEEGLVSKQDGSKPRSILISAEQFIERYVEGDEGSNAEDI